ncbi:unnamed protein product [Adineta steineri]|uniref:Uncharacterized protein n=1 Tax=Adineta steineri TaxID=433720 RepID=A0A814ZIE9_9BILA|nr:unnamed protein product [Adineta steineri]CAF4316850.1 unnamed protein product [Adineta steineri]
MHINLVFLVILIITHTYCIHQLDSSISIPVTAFEYDLFRWPHPTQECDAFLEGLKHDSSDPNSRYNLKADCNRFKLAFACYNSFYSSLDLDTEDGREEKKDLDEHDLGYMETQCANV